MAKTLDELMADAQKIQSGIDKASTALTDFKQEQELPTEEVTPLVTNTQTGTQPDLTQQSGRVSFYQQQIADAEKRAADAQAEREKRQAEFDKQNASLLSQLDDRPTVEDKREEELSALGFKPTEFYSEQKAALAEVGTLMEEYNAAVAAKDEALLKEENRTASMSFIGARMSEVERMANIKLSQMSSNINTKLAIQEMKNDNFGQAQQFAAQAVNDYVYELELDYKQYDRFVEDNRDTIAGLDADIQNAINEQKNLLFTQLDEEKAKASQVMNLMINNPTAGITLNDSLEEAANKARIQGATEAAQAAEVTTGFTEDFESLTPTQIRTAAVEGVPSDASNAIMTALQRGTEDVVITQIKNAYDLTPEEAQEWVNQVKNIIVPREEGGITEEQVWSWLGSDDASGLSNKVKKAQIMKAGFNPSDFNIY